MEQPIPVIKNLRFAELREWISIIEMMQTVRQKQFEEKNKNNA